MPVILILPDRFQKKKMDTQKDISLIFALLRSNFDIKIANFQVNTLNLDQPR